MKKTRIKVSKKRITFMLLPHGGRRSYQITLSYSFIFALFLIWSALTGVGLYYMSQRIENAQLKDANKKLKQKITHFSKKLENALDLVRETQDLNIRLKGLLALQSKKKVIEYSAMGGPSELKDFKISELLKPEFDNSEELFDANFRELLTSAWQTKTSFKEISEYLNYKRNLARYTPAIWPVYGRITSGFGLRINPVTHRPEFHHAFDIANLKGTPIRATADGKVIFAGWGGKLGKTVVIAHNLGYTTYYGHCDEVFVKPGEKVIRGQIIASVGMTGRTTGPHVHYEIHRYGKPLNPKFFMSGGF
ncbi:MAG: M23 family metallopeptidase [Elusimicrobia bacterium]|nr:M23 family metallopeptidase [Elusimicrobiota bacterium]